MATSLIYMYTVGSKHFHDYDKVKVTAGNLPVVVFSDKSNKNSAI